MKKYYIILSILFVIFVGCVILSIIKFVDYKDITEDIVGQEIGYAFTSLIPIGSQEDVPKERPDTSALQAKADTSLGLGITFSVISGLALIAFIVLLLKTIKLKREKTISN